MKGTFKSRARVSASKVLPDPVGPIKRMLLLASSTSSRDRTPLGAAGLQALVVVVHGDRQNALGTLLADHVLIENFLDFLGLGELVPGPLGTPLRAPRE